MSSKLMTASRSEVLKLYRTIIRLANIYPSVRRVQVLTEIRTEFRAKKDETDPKKISNGIKQALFGISHLKKYTNFDSKSSDWVVDLESDPMPAPDRQ
jgi:hypothetical protein